MGDSNNFTSQISVDAETWVDDRSQGGHQRSRRDDPSGAIPRTSGASGIQPSTLPNTDQFYTGRGEEPRSKNYKLSRKEFINKHFDKLSKELKVGFYDVMVLYSENDYVDAEKFRAHLENEIFPEDPGKIKAVLYDGPELEGLAASKLQHLDGGFQRCTFTFVFLTSQFVECDWCNLSSENCLMEAIYNKEKKWCVVPVYTVQRNKADFRIPMGLNSLKGINYYNADDFYRKGVRRLIGDKIIKRVENEMKLHQQRYDYLVRKVREDIERDSRMQLQHEQNQLMLQQCHVENERELLRSRSVMEQPHRNVMYPSAGEFPKTAGDSSHPPYFPLKFVSKQPSEGDDMSSMASQFKKQKLGEANPKYDHQDMTSMPASMGHGKPHSVTDPPRDSSPSSRHSGQSSIPYEDYASAPNLGADHLRGAGQYSAPSMTDITGSKEIHYHYYMNERPTDKTINITAENVIIGENAQIIADGKNYNLEKAGHDINTSSRVNLSNTEERVNNGQGTSSCFMDNGFSTGQSTGIVGNSNPVENDDTEKVNRVPLLNPSTSKELDTSLKSAVNDSNYVPPSNVTKRGIAPVSSTDSRISKYMSSEKNPSQPEQHKHPHEQNIPFNNINKDQPEYDNITKILSPRPKPSPVKLPSPSEYISSPLVAKVQPFKKQSPECVVKGTSEKEETSVKQIIPQTVSHQTEPKVVYTSDSDETSVKTPPRASSLQQSPGERLDPDDTEVLKPIEGQRNSSKVSESSLEIDGCSNLSSSTEESNTVLTKDDLDIKAVNDCIEMGYTEEQIVDALSILKQRRPGHHHFSVLDLLDTLNTKTTSDMFVRNIKTVKDDWVTLTRDETSGEFCETEETSFNENNVSKPVCIRKSSTDPSISNSRKATSPSCKMS